MTRQEIKNIIKSKHVKLLKKDNEKMLKNYLEFCELKKIKACHGTSLTSFMKGETKSC